MRSTAGPTIPPEMEARGRGPAEERRCRPAGVEDASFTTCTGWATRRRWSGSGWRPTSGARLAQHPAQRAAGRRGGAGSAAQVEQLQISRAARTDWLGEQGHMEYVSDYYSHGGYAMPAEQKKLPVKRPLATELNEIAARHDVSWTKDADGIVPGPQQPLVSGRRPGSAPAFASALVRGGTPDPPTGDRPAAGGSPDGETGCTAATGGAGGAGGRCGTGRRRCSAR